MKYAWVVGGGMIQRPLIEEYQRRGIGIILQDGNPDCYCRDLADYLVPIDTYDDELTHRVARQWRGPRPAATMTAGSDVGAAVSAVADVFGLPSCSWLAAKDTRNKAHLRMILKHEHPLFEIVLASKALPGESMQPWEYTGPGHSRREPQPIYDGPFPCVVKPIDASASRGISFVDHPEDLAAAIKLARAECHSQEQVLIEEALGQGLHREASVDWFVWEGQTYYVNGASRHFDPDHFGVETYAVNPWRPPLEVEVMVRNATAALGVDQGPFKTDLIYDDRYGWCLLEATTRWSGSFDHTVLARYATGRDLTKPLVEYSLGLGFDPGICIFETLQYVCYYAPLVPHGQLITEEMVGTIQEHRDVLEVIIVKREPPAEYKALIDRPLFIIARGSTEQAAMRAGREAWLGWEEFARTTNLGGGVS